MVTDLALSLGGGVVIAAVLRLAGIPLVIGFFLGLAALLAFDWLMDRNRDAAAGEEIGSDAPVGVASAGEVLKAFAFLGLGAALTIAMLMMHLYLEGGGAKLAYGDVETSAELAALMRGFGIPPEKATFAVFMGLTVSLAYVAGFAIVAHCLFRAGMGIPSLVQAFRRREESHLGDRLVSFLVPLLLAIVIGALLIGVVYPRATLPLTQLQLLNTLYASEMGEKRIPDPNRIGAFEIIPPTDPAKILEAHEGEWRADVVQSLPSGTVAIHLVIALLAEYAFLNFVNVAGAVEGRQARAIRALRLALQRLFRQARRRFGGDPRTGPAELSVSAPAGMSELSGAAATAPPPEGVDPSARRRLRDRESDVASVADDVPVEERPVHAPGFGFIAPAQAMSSPDDFDVERVINEETGEVTYRVTPVEEARA